MQFDELSSAKATGVGVYSAADVDGIRLLLFQSQEAKHAWNLSELSDQEAWSATPLCSINKLKTNELSLIPTRS